MEQVHIDFLKKFEREIINDVTVSNGIIKTLSIRGILKNDDVKAIINGKNTRSEETAKLLDILPRCGQFAFQEFINSLKHSYSWLSDIIERHLENSIMSTYGGNYTDDLPPCPRFTVIRKELTIQLNQNLNQLRPGEHLAVCGLRGIGKSCLVAKTLNDDKHLVAQLFTNKIYWLNFNYNSERKNIEDEILNQLNSLYEKLNLGTIPSRLQSESLKDCFKRLIRNYLSSRKDKNTLLILNDVTHEAIVDVFDFGCKTLVITDDFSVVRKKEPLHLEISNGFTETESLLLFAMSLDIHQEELPKEAKQIHKQLSGLPLLINMMVAQFRDCKEHIVHDPTLWQYFLRSVQINDNYIQHVGNTFDLCIEKLEPKEKELFYELAVFNDNSNIMPKTLEILWGLEILCVIELMTIFCDKSLVTKKWNQELKCYVYGVHNMLLDHLRIKLGPETMREKHRALIQKYETKCNGDFSKLTIDNYIHFYIGHHLEKAELDLFEKIYLDLKFIQVKIINSGVNDFLIDIEKYWNYIIGNHIENTQKLNELEKFIKRNVKILTKHRERGYLDIIQLALLEDEDGFIFNQAQRLAIEQTAYPYFSRTVISEQESNDENIFTESLTHPTSENITNICFTKDGNSLLWSTENGEIFEKNFASGIVCSFNGLKNEEIKKLVVSDYEQHFLALTKKGDVKLFLFDQNDSQNEQYKEKQSQYIPLFDNKKKDDSLKTFRVNSEIITDVIFTDDELIAACTEQGTVILWNQSGHKVCQLNKDVSLKKIISYKDSPQYELFHAFTNDGIMVTYIFDGNSLNDISMYNFEMTYQNEEETNVVFCRRLKTVPNSLIVVTINKTLYIKWEHSEDVLENITIESQATINDPEEIFESAIVTYDEMYLIIAKSDGCTEIWNFCNEFKLLTSCDWKVSCLDTYWMKEDNYNLLCGKENSLIYKWKLNPKIEELQTVSEPLFNVLVNREGQDTVVRRTNENTLVITKGNQKTWTKTFDINLQGTLSTMIFTKDGKKLIYDTIEDQRQTIFLLDIKSNTVQINYIIKLETVAKLIWLISNFTVSELVIIVEENQELKQICVYSAKQITTHVVKKIGNVIGVYELDTNEILTVTKNCVITYWSANPNNGQLLFVEEEVRKFQIISSTLSPNKNYLGLLTKSRKKILLFQINSIEKNLGQVHIQFYNEIPQLNDRVTCFEFSKNEKYLAIGFKNGKIMFFDMEDKKEIYTSSLLSSCVKNLTWNLDSTILMLTNSEEVALLKTPRKSQPVKLNRKGMCIISKHGEFIESSNQKKHMVQTKMDQSLLLRIIPLPTSNAKVFVSEDFEKMLTVDKNGHVNIFTTLQISDLQSTSNYPQMN